jgi:hypothetical protein
MSLGYKSVLSTAMCYLYLVSMGASVHAQEAPSLYVPDKTIVALLPIVDLSGVTDKSTKAGVSALAREALLHQFTDRGFKYVSNSKISDAAKRLNIDITDPEQQKRSVLLQLGKETGADLVCLVVITDVARNNQSTGIIGITFATVKSKCWLLDVKTSRALLSAKIVAGNTERYSPYSTAPQSEASASAAEQSIINAFKPVFKDYPTLKQKPKTEDSEAHE